MGDADSIMGVLVGLGILAAFVHLGRGRARVLDYHDIPEPRVNECTHGGNGG